MTRKRFKSKIDRWLMLLLVVIMAFEIVVMSIAALQTPDPRAAIGLIVTALLIIALIGSLLIGTHYTVDGNVLRVASGPFHWKVPIDQIQSVEATRSPLSSPALSLDRMRIRYSKNRRIMVSPADKAGFLRAIGQEIGDGER
ncbi:MAG: PH domain-containing protein [Woeseiaceae bacterium]|nr:PH domain-containing protein [Woeseiaceae bacterium]